MEIIERVKSWLTEEEEPEETTEEKNESGDYQKDFQREENIENLDSVILIARPKTFTDAEIIGRQIKKGRAIMLSLEGVVPGEKQRLVDFVSGVVMAEDGLIAKVYDNVYICAAKNIGIISLPFKEHTEKNS